MSDDVETTQENGRAPQSAAAKRTKLIMWAVGLVAVVVSAILLAGGGGASVDGTPVPDDIRRLVLDRMKADGFQWPSDGELTMVYRSRKDNVEVTGPMIGPDIGGNPLSSAWTNGRVFYGAIGDEWSRVRRGGVQNNGTSTPGSGGY